ncbi:hypothetical protein [Vibrio nigripulchritudo]|uniref:hypothetical protein n=1 Tax=Vibrio nigripulchritudo TaxID=28173 RepID=UPI0024901270|nr:hypothetical protein [Vibrio nigripulchritudo]BDU38758.1 hypothetical protein TUMSATVNIG2_32270 [Vibrio nigripulchritudo]BDU44478.1 hypothetical protein TUMSATVNIG3_32760 [Vibrio nigripulchritudo]
MTNLSQKVKELARLVCSLRLPQKPNEHQKHLVGYVDLLEKKETMATEDLEQLHDKLSILQNTQEEIQIIVSRLNRSHNVKLDILRHTDIHKSYL